MDAQRDRTTSGRTPKHVWEDWKAADAAGDAAAAGRLATEMTELLPEFSDMWFEAGMYSKARGDWAESAARNLRAVELFTAEDAARYDGVNPAAWNLGIAATALGDWATARRAWAAYGIQGIEPGDELIDLDFGLVPIRLNPDRPSLPHQIVPDLGDTETVWCRRRSPAHAVISSVPMQSSGHRFRDVLLHDGEPKGTRRLGDHELSVFDELARLDDSGLPTWQAQLTGTRPGDLEALANTLGPRGLGLDDWSGIRLMCSACSHGNPDADHDHAPASTETTVLGLAGNEPDLHACLDPWLAARPHVVLAELTHLW
ncbi:hypothetical protein [Kribbella sp. NPDC051770]|uniref:hypothetical protein n=1 Tax=Kribbella sp. NPDC051770 TaxID=3155413 RepID=UPI00341510B8